MHQTQQFQGHPYAPQQYACHRTLERGHSGTGQMPPLWWVGKMYLIWSVKASSRCLPRSSLRWCIR